MSYILKSFEANARILKDQEPDLNRDRAKERVNDIKSSGPDPREKKTAHPDPRDKGLRINSGIALATKLH